MKIHESTKGDITVVAPEGEIDITNADILKERLNGLIDTGRTAILVDFSAVEFITSSGINVLVSVLKRIKEEDGKLALCSVSERIESVFDSLGLTQFFDINPSCEEALVSMS